MNRGVVLSVVACLVIAGAVALRWMPHEPLSRHAPSSTAVYATNGELLRLTLAADEQYRLWTPLPEVGADYVDALLYHEDQRFRWHVGVDPVALVRAAVRTGSGDGRQGGSTITMQLARLVYHLNTRNVAGKAHQIALALWLELRYSKDEILEAHINLAPYGRNIQGVGAASLIYFGKRPDQLSVAESLALAVIPQAPTARTPKGAEPPSLRAARVRLAERWVKDGGGSPEALAAATQPLAFKSLGDLPFEAPHLVTALLGQQDPQPLVRTTLDLSLQRLVRRTVSQYLATQKAVGVNNAAVLLVDYRSMGVKAWMGSADFFDSAISGQVDGVSAKRSPGSTLKPFIYGLAIDQGLIHTRSMLKDAPTAFGTYSPENFDGAFIGPVSAHDALIASRNVPAVGLASRIAQPSLYQFLKSAGVARMASERHYGLALALGGGEVTMEELVTLYAMLGNGGLLAPLRYTETAPSPAPARVLSDEAAYMVLSILRDNPRPDNLVNANPPVAWKTGTSWGFRDAWTVGVVGPYVLAVWVGNFDGSSNAAFVGTQVAAPLFFRLFDGIRGSSAGLQDGHARPPAGVVQVEVCAASGELPNADCPNLTKAWFIPGKSPIRVSTVHRRVPIDSRTGRRACAATPARYVRTEVFEYWPSDVLRLFSQAGMPRRAVPDETCDGGAISVGSIEPEIVYPVTGATYQVRTSRRDEDSMQLNATAGPEVRSLYWFADGAFVGTSRPSSPLAWTPRRTGEVVLSVVDDHGGTAVRTVRVAAIP